MKQKLFFLTFALTAFFNTQAYDIQVDDLCYNITSDTEPYTVEVAPGDGYYRLEVIEIPETVENGGKTYSVTSIGSGAFSGCSGLTSVTIPNSVTSIGSEAFFRVRHINYNGSATGSPWGAYSINGITDGDFVYSDADKKTLIAYIGTGGNVTIPNSVTSIGESAFYGCSGLTSVTIPNSVTSIGIGAFSDCDKLTFNEYDNALYLGNSENPYLVLVKAKSTDITSCEINQNCRFIHSSAFFGCSGLTSVTIPNSVTSIGDLAFYYCSGLTSVTIPNSVTSIGSSAFEGCSGLTSVTIPNSVTSIGNYAFEYCSGLTSVTIPNSVTSIGSYAFAGCSGLTSVTIPNSVTSIGYGAFYDCSGLTSVTIPNSVTSIGKNAFYGCSNLTIRCEASSRPDGWAYAWNYENRPVVWGYVGISEAIASNVKIYAHHNVIVVENADAEIGIFDATGRCVARSKARHVSMAMPRQGLYIVKVGAIATRVVVE